MGLWGGLKCLYLIGLAAFDGLAWLLAEVAVI